MLSRGFTKIEIIIVLFLILIVITLDIFVVLYLNKKQRDIQVLAEINQLRSGFEVFLMSNNFYPAASQATLLNDDYSGTEKLCLEGFKKLSDACKKKSIMVPLPNFYINQGNQYSYKSADNNQNYQIEFVLDTNFKSLGLKKGKNCATNAQILSQPCF
ncbi:MAG: hypothetical protein NTX00_02700 [Candidatus Parcubacteria bacterium]|nr:hypothetical protein [Candidatus Parcubacteria bacterium]